MNRPFGPFQITDDPAAVDFEKVVALLKPTYWAGDRPSELIAKSIQHSICISVFFENEQVGFARVVTDRASFAWIADVIVDERFQGRGLGKEIMRFIQDHPEVPASRQLLRTKDAHGLYEQFGFTRQECMMK